MSKTGVVAIPYKTDPLGPCYHGRLSHLSRSGCDYEICRSGYHCSKSRSSQTQRAALAVCRGFSVASNMAAPPRLTPCNSITHRRFIRSVTVRFRLNFSFLLCRSGRRYSKSRSSQQAAHVVYRGSSVASDMSQRLPLQRIINSIQRNCLLRIEQWTPGFIELRLL